MNEQELTAYVDYYLDNLKSGKRVEDAVHSLMDVVPEATDLLLLRYRALDNREDKDSILHIFKETLPSIVLGIQRTEIIDLFGRELLSDRSESWKQALDALSTANDEVALTHLNSALNEAVKTKSKKKETWIREVLADRK